MGASINEFSTDGDIVQNSDVKVPTQAAIRTYINKLTSINPGGNNGTFTINGNLQVDGTTTTVNSTNTTIADHLIELGTGTTGPGLKDSGIVIERGANTNVFMGYDESVDKFVFAQGNFTGASTGDLTFTGNSTILANFEGTLTGNASSATVADGLQNTPNITVGTVGCGTITGSGEISDSKGGVRRIPGVNKTSSYTLAGVDDGQHINITTGGITVPSNQFATGQAVTIYNNSGSSQTITQGSGVTLRKVGSATTGNRTLAQRGLATILCVGANDFVITGGGIS